MTSPSFVLSKDTARTFRAAWRAFSQQGNASAGDHLLQALMLGKDPLRAFAPVSNQLKLANGHAPHLGLRLALNAISTRYGSTSREHLARIAPELRDDAEAARALENAISAFGRTLNAAEGK